ncbi:MAG: lytic murein transglycosylase B [Burkholderiales bacterium]
MRPIPLPVLRALGVVAAIAVLGAPAPSPAAGAPADQERYGRRADVLAFAAEVAADAGLDRRRVERWLAGARYQARIVDLMSRPIVDPPKWYDYSPPFLSAERIAAGVAWWKANDDALVRAEARFGVPPEIVVAIIGVETYYGRATGTHRVIDALATLAFDYPRRAPFFRGELKEFLRLVHEQGVSPSLTRGSFAGAMGVPQFMPGSYRRYAVDFDGDARIDLFGSAADAIGSVANYLARHDWRPGGPLLVAASVAPQARDTIARRLDGGISERRPLELWAADGVEPALALEPVDEPVALVSLEESADQSSVWIACPNFYVITRYNRSRLYAAAVVRLAEALRDAR